MKETRAGKYGRCLGEVINQVIGARVERQEVYEYKMEFLSELRRYSLIERRKGSPVNEGCNYELEGIENVDVGRPGEVARLVKEGIHLMYQKNTARKVLDALVEELERN